METGHPKEMEPQILKRKQNSVLNMSDNSIFLNEVNCFQPPKALPALSIIF